MGLLKADHHNLTAMPQPTPHAVGGFNAILDRGSAFEGKLTFEGTVRIDGKFKGEIISEANLVVGESGQIEADIQVDSITVSGQIRGNIAAKSRVEIHAPAVIHGNIQTPVLIVEEGAVFEGNCSMEKFADQKKHKARLNDVSRDPLERKKDSENQTQA